MSGDEHFECTVPHSGNLVAVACLSLEISTYSQFLLESNYHQRLVQVFLVAHRHSCSLKRRFHRVRSFVGGSKIKRLAVSARSWYYRDNEFGNLKPGSTESREVNPVQIVRGWKRSKFLSRGLVASLFPDEPTKLPWRVLSRAGPPTVCRRAGTVIRCWKFCSSRFLRRLKPFPFHPRNDLGTI